LLIIIKLIMESFRQVIHQARQVLQSTTQPLRICLGNVSVDMDSVVGSLSMAYYYGLKFQKPYIPVVNCKRSFFPMKLDINMHLQEHGVPELIFLEDLDLSRIVEVCLIDHNKLDQSQVDTFGPYVKRVIDHHIDTKTYDG
jgi:exopolyphosphatase